MNCDRTDCTDPAVAVIPLPDLHGKPQDINVCETHFRAADDACFYVVRFDEPEGVANGRCEAKIKAKHRRIVGSDKLRVDSVTGGWLPETTYAGIG